MTAISMSIDPESRENYGPYVPNVGPICPTTGKTIRFNNVSDLEEALNAHGKDTAAFIVEPIQGEAGVVVPDEDYLAKVHALCKKHNVLLICDEIQTGIGRTGRMLCSEWAGIKPDMVTLGKAISGGLYPVSCVMSNKNIMLVVEPGTHGSTYGGNPLGCAVSLRALEIMEEENLTEKADILGQIFRESIASFKSPIVKTIRGKGLLNAIVIDESATNDRTAWDLCILLKEKGVLVRASFFFPMLRYVTVATAFPGQTKGLLKLLTKDNGETRLSPHMAILFDLRRHWSFPKNSFARRSG